MSLDVVDTKALEQQGMDLACVAEYRAAVEAAHERAKRDVPGYPPGIIAFYLGLQDEARDRETVSVGIGRGGLLGRVSGKTPDDVERALAGYLAQRFGRPKAEYRKVRTPRGADCEIREVTEPGSHDRRWHISVPGREVQSGELLP